MVMLMVRFIFLLISFLFLPSPAQACNCQPKDELEDRLSHFDHVYFAKLVNMKRPEQGEYSSHDLELFLHVTEVMKGEPGEIVNAIGYSVAMAHPYVPDTQVCRFDYRIGQEFIIFESDQEPVYIGNCSISELVSRQSQQPIIRGIRRISPNPLLHWP